MRTTTLILSAWFVASSAAFAVQLQPPAAQAEEDTAPPPKATMPRTGGVFHSDFAEDGGAIAVATHPMVTTTIHMPYPIEGMDGRGFTRDPATVAGDFLIMYTPNKPIFSVSPKQPYQARRNVNVFCASKVISFDFFVTAKAEDACKTLIIDPPPVQLDNKNPLVTRSKRPPKNDNALKPVTTPRLVGLIDTAKLMAQFSDDEAAYSMKGVPNMSCDIKSGEKAVTDSGSYEVRTHRVYRNSKLDGLILHCTVLNKTNRTLSHDPTGAVVRCGGKALQTIIADVQPSIAPNERAQAYFAIAGTPEGEKNFLSASNDFHVALAINPSGELFRDNTVVVAGEDALPQLEMVIIPKTLTEPIVIDKRREEPAAKKEEKPQGTGKPRSEK